MLHNTYLIEIFKNIARSSPRTPPPKYSITEQAGVALLAALHAQVPAEALLGLGEAAP